MKKGTKEFYAAQDCFDRTLKSFPMIRAADTAREGGSVSGVYYQNGDTNSAFICFLQGVAYAKCEHVLPLRRDVAEMVTEIEKLKAENERLKAGDAAREVVKMSGKRSLVYGVGVNDWAGDISVDGKPIKEYRLWQDMLKRCFSEKCKQSRPTYEGVTCSKEWFSMTAFIEDVSQMKGFGLSGWQLDKDILQKGNKLYSKDTCCFVPLEVNILLTKSDKSRGEYPVGVYFDKHAGKFKAQIKINGKVKYLGLFNTPEEAFQAYKRAKEAQIKVVAQKWKHLLDEWVFQALMVYEVAIDD